MNCPRCEQPVETGAHHCIHCGETLPGGGAPPRGEEIQGYLVPAILVTIFCCLPFGIVAIIFAAQVGGKLDMGDYAGARDASRRARNWCIVTVVCGIIGYLGGLLWLFLMVLAAGSMGH